MASVTTSFHLNGAALDSLLNGPNGPVARELERRGELIAAEARRLAPKKTGNLAANIRAALVSTNGKIEERVGLFGASARAVPYFKYVDRGTGLYGPTRTPIRPRHAQALRFVVNGRVVYATKVSGQRPNHFLKEALAAGRS